MLEVNAKLGQETTDIRKFVVAVGVEENTLEPLLLTVVKKKVKVFHAADKRIRFAFLRLFLNNRGFFFKFPRVFLYAKSLFH